MTGIKARIIETIPCSKCNEHKPYPADYITSYNKATVESTCSACRAIRRKELKLKREGKQTPQDGWRSAENNYRKRSNAVIARIRKEKDVD